MPRRGQTDPAPATRHASRPPLTARGHAEAPPPPAARGSGAATALQHFRTTRAYMDTPVTIAIVASADDPACAAAAERAFAWFAEVEARCSRFDPASELRQLADRPPGEAVVVSPLLFEAVRFACAVAERAGGAFDPAVGARQQARGIVRNYRTGRDEPWRAPASGGRLAAEAAAAPAAGGQPGKLPAQPAGEPATAAGPSGLPAAAPPPPAPAATWRDVALDAAARTIRLRRPLLLDLGAVAKGMAIDLAARELAATHRDFLVEAGGDLFASGRNPEGRPWRVGIRHPRAHDAFSAVLAVTDAAVCTSGDYARPAPDGGHHIVDPRTADLRTTDLRTTDLRTANPRAADLPIVDPPASGLRTGDPPSADPRPADSRTAHPRAADPCATDPRAADPSTATPPAADPHPAPATGTAAVSCTVLAPSAMLADALATAAFVLGPTAGLAWLADEGVEGLIVGTDLRSHATAGFARHAWQPAPAPPPPPPGEPA